MKLKTIYNIKSLDFSDSKIEAKILFNKNHEVFKGHFPNNPIVPGVVQIQIIKDLLGNILHKKVFLNHAKSIKFLNVINPLEMSEVLFEIMFFEQSENSCKVECVVKSESLVFMKYSGNTLLQSIE